MININLFKKDLPTVSTKELIEQIHSEFNNAGEELLKQANEILSNNNFSSEKADRLEKLGFTATKEVVDIKNKKEAKKLADSTVNLIQMYRLHYPNQKFITEEMVAKICSKYSLVCGVISKYKGFVPIYNLKQIEEFKLREEDILYARINMYMMERYEIITKEEYDNFHKTTSYINVHIGMDIAQIIGEELKICAPLKDMDMKGMRLSGYKIEVEIPDPVVLKQVKGGYLILTAWGDEASDPIVVNQINN